MPLIFTLGWRNLARRKWRTTATAFMLCIGAFLLVFMTGVAEGVYGTMIEVGTRVLNGDFQVIHSDYNKKPALFKTVTAYQEVGEQIRKDPRVSGISYRVEAPGLLSYENQTMGGLLLGMEPTSEISGYLRTLTQGAWWQTEYGDQLPVVLGSGVVARLKVKLGQEITYVGQGADGSIAAERLTLVGVVETGVPELDRSMGFIPLDLAQELLVVKGRVHRIICHVHDRATLPALGTDLQLKEPLRFLDWKTMLPELAHSITADRRGGLIFLSIIIAVILISVANSMLMSVMERKFELGVIQALGTPPLTLTLIILAEMAWLGLIGLIPGVAMGMAMNGWLGTRGVQLGLEELSFGGVSLSVVYPANTVAGCVIYPLLVLTGMMVAGLVPAIKASMTHPVDAMRD